MKIGIIGGTFDPIHLGHLIAAEEAMLGLKFDKMFFIPAGRPWLKAKRKITPAEDRCEMVRLAIAGQPRFELSTVEVERPGPSYTAETIMMLREKLGGKARLYFLLGCDSLSQLPLWKNPAQIIAGCHLVALPRREGSPPGLGPLEKEIPGLSRKVIWLDMPIIDISSTGIRRRVARGLSIRYLVPRAVELYIKEHRLYIR